MSFPAFTVTSKLTDNTTTTQSSIVRVINNLIINLQQIFTSLLNRVQLDTILLQGIQLNAGKPTIIPHTLGRTLTGWYIVGQSAATLKTIYDNQATNLNPTTNLILVSDTAITINLLVF
jgi:hypothetical protein